MSSPFGLFNPFGLARIISSTDDLPEGSSNLYFTDERAQDAIALLIQNGTGISWVYNDAGNTLTPTVTLAPFSTSNLAEGSNLYYTDERVDDRVAALLTSGTAIVLTYNDVGNTLEIAVSLDAIDDHIAGTLFQEGTGINFAYNDLAGTFTLSVDFGDFDTGDLVEGSNLYFTNERAQDAVAGMLTEGTGIDLTYDDGANTFTITLDLSETNSDALPEGATNLYFTNERVDDRINGLMVEGTGIDFSYNDGANTFTISANLSDFSTSNLTEGTNLYYTDERVDDRMNATIAAGTGIAKSYDDGGNTLTLSVDFTEFTTANITEGSNLYYTDERVDDRVNALIVAGNGIDTAYNDGAGTFTITLDLTEDSTTNLPEGSNLYHTTERVQDVVGAMLVAGTDIDITYDDGAGTVTIDSTASAGNLPDNNRFSNPNGMIDQRKAGAAQAAGTGTTYGLDRWWGQASGGGAFTITRELADNEYNILLTVTANDASIASPDYYAFGQSIEGLNIIDFKQGGSDAENFTVTFEVKCSITGTFYCGVRRGDAGRTYLTSFTVNAANTWEEKTVTITGDTTASGAYVTNGIAFHIDLGTGSNYHGSTGWQSSNKYTVAGATNLIATNGATMRLRKFRMHKGDNDLGYKIRTFDAEFAHCQRYFETNVPYGTAPANGIAQTLASNYQPGSALVVTISGTQYLLGYGKFNVPKRVAATMTAYRDSAHATNGAFGRMPVGGSTWTAFTTTITGGTIGFEVQGSGLGLTNGHNVLISGWWTASAEF